MNTNPGWSIADSTSLYHVNRWGQDFFRINDRGEVEAQLGDHSLSHRSLFGIVADSLNQGISAPLLVRFTPIIRKRLECLKTAFANAINEFQLAGTYTCVYPVKVNQHREIIDAFVDAAQDLGGGLEAGSKAELMAVIGLATADMPILCTGFKDQTVVEMALRASQIGKNITVIIERLSDVALIARVSRKLKVRPRLGIRVKLAARSAGRWKSSVGSKSKFGLSAPEVSEAIALLRGNGLLDACHLLHFHPGSQINNVRNIKACVIEATQIYAELVRQGVPLMSIDVGGGLAVDYTGNRDLHASSMNYSLQEYANDVVYYIRTVCDQQKVAHPNILSESGRAVVAHHSVLIVPVIGASGPSQAAFESPREPDQVLPLIELREIVKELDESRNLLESYHDAQQALEMAQQLFINGHLTLMQRAEAESLVSIISLRIRDKLNELDFVPQELAELRHVFAETYLTNFSVFQSLPDHWALDQLFPIMPIHRLDERPNCNAVISDITCDSDGTISSFIGDDPPAPSLPVHALRPDEPYYLGIFLLGAYQEALSDDHNLMGKFHVVTVDDPRGSPRIATGSNLRDVLEHVHHDLNELLKRIEVQCQLAVQQRLVNEETLAQTAAFFEHCAEQYTYLLQESDPAGDETRLDPPHRAALRPRPVAPELT